MMNISKKTIIIGSILLLLILSLYTLLSSPRKLYGNPIGEINFEMPEKIDFYDSENILFCLNDQCANSFSESKLPADNKTTCPYCNGELSHISIGEIKLLPVGTPIYRKEYSTGFGPQLQTTVVFTGLERRSIHRPQVCLVSQGNRITNEYDYFVELKDNHKLKTKVIELTQEYTNQLGEKKFNDAVYVYWFFNPERETNSHLLRFLYMALDNALRNYRPRWAYVSICFQRDPNNPNEWKNIINDFVPRFYPYLQELRKDMLKDRDVELIINSQGTSALNTEINND